MGQLVLLVVAAAWAAVLLPPLLRSRVENRPNSSVTDFRRQLNRLQTTVPQRAGGSLRPVGRPLTSSPLQRPAAGGRPGDARARTPASRGGQPERTHADPRARDHVPGSAAGPAQGASLRSRAHGDHTAGHQRGHQRAHQQAQVRRSTPAHDARRRRANVLFSLVLVAASTLFLAATTKATVMLYIFALAFLALCGYVYLLAQLRQREQQSASATWPNGRAGHR